MRLGINRQNNTTEFTTEATLRPILDAVCAEACQNFFYLARLRLTYKINFQACQAKPSRAEIFLSTSHFSTTSKIGLRSCGEGSVKDVFWKLILLEILARSKLNIFTQNVFITFQDDKGTTHSLIRKKLRQKLFPGDLPKSSELIYS